MAESLQEMLDYINEVTPNAVNTTTIIGYINKEQKKYWEKLTSTTYHDFTLSSGVAYYDLPADCKFEYIRENGLSVYNTTSAISSSDTEYTKYSYAGADEEFVDESYYRFTTQLGIYPVPTTSGQYARLWYQQRPTVFATTAGSTDQFNLDDDWIDFIRYKVMARVAVTGNNPDIEMKNNYELEAQEVWKSMLMRKAKEKMKDTRKRNSYREGWGCY